LKAFGKYKRVMTSVYPDRRAELDAYEDDIIDIYNFFGSKFYDYHKLFYVQKYSWVLDTL
jgi:hypothetical protein